MTEDIRCGVRVIIIVVYRMGSRTLPVSDVANRFFIRLRPDWKILAHRPEFSN